jgi:hypothetical protein
LLGVALHQQGDHRQAAESIGRAVTLNLGNAAYHANLGKRPVRTASVSQVRQPIYQRSVARRKHYEQALGPLFDRLGDASATSTTATDQHQQ